MTTTHKTRFNLSEIMHNAHQLFKTQRGTAQAFADCLREAWRAAKRYIGRSIEIIWMWGFPTVKVQESAEYAAGCSAYYANSRSGQHFGD
jgi:hypothetical protein